VGVERGSPEAGREEAQGSTDPCAEQNGVIEATIAVPRGVIWSRLRPDELQRKVQKGNIKFRNEEK